METETTVVSLDRLLEQLWRRIEKLSYELDVAEYHTKKKNAPKILWLKIEIRRLTDLQSRIAHLIYYQTITPKPRKSRAKQPGALKLVS